MLRNILLIGVLSTLLGCESNVPLPQDQCYLHSNIISGDVPIYFNSNQIISFNPLMIRNNGNILIFNTEYYLNCNTNEFKSIGN